MKKLIVAVLLMVVGLAFTGCNAMTGRTTGEYIDDATITTRANGVIVNDPDAAFFKIDVSSTNGHVVLMGFIHDRSAEDRIVTKIRDIKGVKSVKSELKVQPKK